jgi:hypothetical protein
MIVCVSPDAWHKSETLSALRFSQRARSVMNVEEADEADMEPRELCVAIGETREK